MASTSSSPSTPLSKSKILEDALQRTQLSLLARNHLIWGSVNLLAVAVVFFHYSNSNYTDSFKDSLIRNAERIFILTLSLNVLFHLFKYCQKHFQTPNLCLSPEQKKLLGIRGIDSSYREGNNKTEKSVKGSPTNSQSQEMVFTATSPMNLSSSSWLSMSALNESVSPTANYIPSPSSFPHQISPPSFSYGFSLGHDPNSSSRYLDNYHHQTYNSRLTNHTNLSLGGSYWDMINHSNVRGVTNSSNINQPDVSPVLRRNTYQLSPTTNVPHTNSPSTPSEEAGSPLAQLNTIEICRRLKIDQSQLTKWNANLRLWISLTILQRLVEEFDYINTAFQRCGLSDMQVGAVGLDRLKKTASVPQMAASVPSLPRLVPFLEISPHQEYVVSRIRELARGGCMSDYCWSGGGSLNNKNWEDHLPTDAVLVMHLIATYLDLQLLPIPHQLDARPFSSQFLVRTPEKPGRGQNNPIIYQAQNNPPHFQLIDRDEILDVPKGRHNVFLVLLLFLHIQKTRGHGMLGPVNLGKSGINIMWVIDTEN